MGGTSTGSAADGHQHAASPDEQQRGAGQLEGEDDDDEDEDAMLLPGELPVDRSRASEAMEE